MREPLKLALVAPPATMPLTLEEAKQHLRLDAADTADDALVATLVRAATAAAERFTGRALLAQTWDLFLDRWPPGAEEPLWEGRRIGADLVPHPRAIALPLPPLRAVVHVKTYDDADAATTWDAANYFVDTASAPGRLALRGGRAWPLPGRTANGIEIRFDAGYGEAVADVPEPLRQGLRQLLAWLYENRGDGMEAAAAVSGATGLWLPYRLVRL
jgi:hypothetical protein